MCLWCLVFFLCVFSHPMICKDTCKPPNISNIISSTCSSPCFWETRLCQICKPSITIMHVFVVLGVWCSFDVFYAVLWFAKTRKMSTISSPCFWETRVCQICQPNMTFFFGCAIFFIFLSSIKPTASLVILQNQVKWLEDSIIKLHQI